RKLVSSCEETTPAGRKLVSSCEETTPAGRESVSSCEETTLAKQTVDVVVIGGGPSGLMAATTAAQAGAAVILLDRQQHGGEKLLLSGGGRCNLLPATEDFEAYFSDAPRHTVRRILSTWRLDDVRAFIEQHARIELEEKKRTGKLFPVRGGGEEVRRRLTTMARRANVELRMKSRVVEVQPTRKLHVFTEKGDEFVARAVVLAMGGRSYPRTGSDGSGFRLAEGFGHCLVNPYPALVALRTDRAEHRALAGVSVDVELRAYSGEGDQRVRLRTEGALLFTHRGYSGPAVLNAGHVVARAIQQQDPFEVRVSWGGITEAVWHEAFARNNDDVRGAIRGLLPTRLAETLLSEISLPGGGVPLDERTTHRVIKLLTDDRLSVTGTSGFGVAEVTGGGVRLEEVDTCSLESLISPGVFFAGELLDVFGTIGGYNFLWAFVTGRLAGAAAAARAKQRSA
ncbi:aminoacetone oxidase family FAD-binding enzyme, partial [Candidatus Bipolaricaulota bacterium]|nr:aminoacetone oxidase family FAD-binding enzyme [Candidatus Bipolaricaulota bacterium]